MARDTNRGESVPRITDAPSPHTDEMRARMIKYSVSMGIRVVCLFLMFFVHGWLLWVVIAGAVVLPYFAVIIANGGSDSRLMTASDAMIDSPPATTLDAPRAAEEPGESPETTVLPGEIVDNDYEIHDDEDKA
ncbi:MULTISPECIES: DUF3099 domain-containing protein [Arthrobacter]|uniref:DUF3099 domain-containing protein n=1 Tax=Arthrobacter jinronghuae TaxID=2964609 RepID=A0ABT1NR20_9MICC|nr:MULTISPECIES: DUF3099 domain-containing protein [Arthrobacter]MCQ1950181.1 DUF3099 domain-containing protein [Arthrobacter jinronghuae]MCQ1953420.1 DUF3099 domain-containing protein [Arthrobacter sp. zg-Y238]MCQ1956654.1 DUF3099 domain-containing protein [Arthrobacter jinronghuae]UWX77166.1 DUF3099 domain-containing protein [Arthrobacter jinronghuae]